MRISDWSSGVCSSDLADVGNGLIDVGKPVRFRQIVAEEDQARDDAWIVGHQLARGERVEHAPQFGAAPENDVASLRRLSSRLIVREADPVSSEARLAGTECVSQCITRWSPSNKKKKTK